MPYILVVGGAGFLGSHVCGQLAARGTHQIVVSDMFGAGDKWKNLAHHPIHEVVAPSALFYWLEMYGAETDCIVHLASIPDSEANVDLKLESHLAQPSLLFKWCAENGKRFIWGSTQATYGDGANGYRDDHQTSYLNTLRPSSASAWSKHRFDSFACGSYERKQPTPPQWAGLKFSHLYGPNEFDKGVDASFITQLLQSKAALPVEDVQQTQDFLYVKDAAMAVLWFIDNAQLSGLFNIGSGEVRTLGQAAEAVQKMLGQPRSIVSTKGAKYFLEPTAPSDIRKLRATGFAQPMMSLEQGVVDYIQHYWLTHVHY